MGFFLGRLQHQGSGQKRLQELGRLICLRTFCFFHWDVMENVACFVCSYVFSYMSLQEGTKNIQSKFE